MMRMQNKKYLYTTRGKVNWYNHFGKFMLWWYILKLNTRISFDLTFILLSTCLIEIFTTYINHKVCTRMFMTVVF